MGLFGNNNSQQQDEQRRRQEEEQRRRQEEEQRQKREEEQEREFKQRKYYVKMQPGINVKFQYSDSASEVNQTISEQADLDKAPDYKFMITEDEYLFMYNFSPYAAYTPTEYKKMISNEDVHLQKNEYHAELINTSYLPKQSTDFAAELTVEQQPIYIVFKSFDKPEILVAITDLGQDFSILGSFMKDIGVKNYRNIMNVPEDFFSVRVVNGEAYLSENSYVIFREGNKLYLIRNTKRSESNAYIAQIDVDKIQYYRSEGSLRYEQDVSGGGGGGINYSGAIIGGLLFGDAGAVIGSRQEIEEIKTQTITHDDRVTMLAIKAQGSMYRVGFDVGAEDVFDWLIPEKQYDYVISKRREMFEKQTGNN